MATTGALHTTSTNTPSSHSNSNRCLSNLRSPLLPRHPRSTTINRLTRPNKKRKLKPQLPLLPQSRRTKNLKRANARYPQARAAIQSLESIVPNTLSQSGLLNNRCIISGPLSLRSRTLSFHQSVQPHLMVTDINRQWLPTFMKQLLLSMLNL